MKFLSIIFLVLSCANIGQKEIQSASNFETDREEATKLKIKNITHS